MPWKEESTMSLRTTFMAEAQQEGANISQLCRQYGISRKTGYKWLARHRSEGMAGLEDQSRRPKSSPNQTATAIEAELLKVREAHPTWSGYKIKAYLLRRGWEGLPAHSTIHAILQRNGKIDPKEGQKHKPYQRFEMAAPNELWQMDFKGHFPLRSGADCHPLTVLDDHSRFLLGLRACPDETRETVQEQLKSIFRQYGLPERMLMDNGSPWGYDEDNPYTALSAWLLRLGIRISHGRAYHPQTQGKEERFHRTLKEDLLERVELIDYEDSQARFDAYRDLYNHERPHQALQMAVPADHYQPSPHPFPEQLPPIHYDPFFQVRMVAQSGRISFRNRSFRVGKAFRHYPVGIQPIEPDGDFAVFFCQEKIAQISFREDNC